MPRLSAVTAGRTALVPLIVLWGCDARITEPNPTEMDVPTSLSAMGGLALLDDQPVHSFQSPQPQASAQFGSSVANVGGNVLIGVPLEDAAGVSGAGRAYLFGTDGEPLVSFQAPDAQASARFGWSVAASSENLVVGASTHRVDGLTNSGQAYLFGPEGAHRLTLRSPEPQSFAQFGGSVAVVGENILIGARGNTVSGRSNAGQAYLFSPDGSLLQVFQAPEPQGSAQFGTAVAGLGENILVGAWNEIVDGVRGAGRAYLFAPDGSHLATFQPPTPGDNDRFGMAVSGVDGNVLVGAPLTTVGGQFAAGRAHLFAPDGTHLRTLESPEPQGGAQFGFAVGGVGQNLLVSANIHDVGEAVNAGQAYLFAPDGTGLLTFRSPELAEGFTGFGTAVTGTAQHVIIGAATHNVGEESNAGRAYLFELPPELVDTNPEDPTGPGDPEDPEDPEESDPATIAEGLLDSVDALEAQGLLSRGQARSLTATLNSALEAIEDGRTKPACNQLGAFIQQVGSRQQSGRLSDEEAEGLIADAEAAREELCGPTETGPPGDRSRGRGRGGGPNAAATDVQIDAMG